MCGIFGMMWHKSDAVPPEPRLRETAMLLSHRGPDSHGIFADAGIGMVHTRLSLLDLSSRGDQPFWDRGRRYCFVYNGEIYNFKELREELERDGVSFRTTTDTEVILEWIINRGIDATLARIEGMFAFALYDTVERTLLLARDRFGIKPLFIHEGDGEFAFASEMRAMRPWIKFEPDGLSISSYLFGFEGPSKGYTFLKGVKFLPPGTVASVRRGEAARYKRYAGVVDLWDKGRADELRRLSARRIVDSVDELLSESVKMQLFADAPVGVLCSGGIDSSVITAMAARIHDNVAIFHANVVGPSSEYEAAEAVARHLKLDLKAIDVHENDFIDLIPEVIEHFGHPFCIIPSSVPFIMVAKLIRDNHVKAVLSGEGSDECFLGYNFLVPSVKRMLRQPQVALRRALKGLLGAVRGGPQGAAPNFVMGFSPYYGWYSNFSPRRSTSLPEMMLGLHNRFEVALETREIQEHIERTNGGGRAGRGYMDSLDLLNYNLRVLLHRNDTMGMAASIESRFPFLDSSLVGYAVNMPHSCKIRFSPTSTDNRHPFFVDKWVLRKVADRYLPKEISGRPKKQFNDNTYSRLRISPSYFERSFIADYFGLSQPELRYLVENAGQDLRLRLLHLDVWAGLFLHGLSRQSITEGLRKHLAFGGAA